MQNAEKISVTLTPDMLRLLRETVEVGEYASTSEAVRDAVRVWHRQRLEDAERLDAIRARVRRSLDDPGGALTETELDRRLRAMFDRASASSGDAEA